MEGYPGRSLALSPGCGFLRGKGSMFIILIPLMWFWTGVGEYSMGGWFLGLGFEW